MRGQPQKDIAAATGVDHSAISRWLDPESESQPRADKVITFARALNADPVQALVAAGYLNDDDVNTSSGAVLVDTAEMSVDEISNEIKRLFREMHRRAEHVEKPTRRRRANPAAPPV